MYDGGKTFAYNLPYAQMSSSVASLRPGVKVEISSWPLQRKAVPCAVSSFVAQAQGITAEVAAISCVDIGETAADKFVALTRRIAEEQHTQRDRDRTLLRHVYDLYRLRPHVVPKDLQPMIREVMENDRKTRSRKFPAYAENPAAVSLDAIEILAGDDSYTREFELFQRDMVYGAHVALRDCLPVLRELAALL